MGDEEEPLDETGADGSCWAAEGSGVLIGASVAGGSTQTTELEAFAIPTDYSLCTLRIANILGAKSNSGGAFCRALVPAGTGTSFRRSKDRPKALKALCRQVEDTFHYASSPCPIL